MMHGIEFWKVGVTTPLFQKKYKTAIISSNIHILQQNLKLLLAIPIKHVVENFNPLRPQF